MGRQKTDFEALKLEFFDSDHDELSPFLREKGLLKEEEDLSKKGGSFNESVAGWTVEKKAWKKAIYEKAQQAVEKKKTEAWEKTLTNVDVARRNGLNVIAKVLGDKKVLEKIKTPRDIARLVPTLRHLKLEAGEETESVNTKTEVNVNIKKAKPRE